MNNIIHQYLLSFKEQIKVNRDIVVYLLSFIIFTRFERLTRVY